MKKKIVFMACWLFCAGYLFAQSSGFEANVNTAGVFGLEYRLNQRFAAGGRFDGGKMDAGSLTPFVKIQLKQYSDASLFMGIGLKGLDPLGDISIPIGIRATPFGDSSNLGLVLELENIVGDDYYLRPSIGLSYRFGK